MKLFGFVCCLMGQDHCPSTAVIERSTSSVLQPDCLMVGSTAAPEHGSEKQPGHVLTRCGERWNSCGASAQVALEELGSWFDKDLLVFAGNFLGQPNITLGLSQPSVLLPVPSSSVFLFPLPLPTFSRFPFLSADRKKRAAILVHLTCILSVPVNTCERLCTFFCPPTITAVNLEYNINANQSFNVYKQHLRRLSCSPVSVNGCVSAAPLPRRCTVNAGSR